MNLFGRIFCTGLHKEGSSRNTCKMNLWLSFGFLLVCANIAMSSSADTSNESGRLSFFSTRIFRPIDNSGFY